MARVRPGVELVRATLSPTSELITLDLPKLERPRKAISGRLGTGKCAASVADAMKRERTLIRKFATGAGNWQARQFAPGAVRTSEPDVASGFPGRGSRLPEDPSL